RLDRLPEGPTWKEQGINVVCQLWKGIMGPKDMTEEEVAYWDDVIKRMVESDSWKGILRERGWESFYILEESSGWYGGMVGGDRGDK
ncbi:tripartite tricarboxylate transporter substrate binding protein, partial [Bacillus paranthracis]|nr:tripartite tricarboxylate transporter substrate binding protein [Bacillus paranthracis]